jgi:hypothetical protein
MVLARQLVALQLIDDAAFGPDVLRAIRQAFDQVWSEIAWRFGTQLVVIEAARLKLADTLLSIASEDTRDVEVLKCFALQAMARHPPNTSVLPLAAVGKANRGQSSKGKRGQRTNSAGFH